LDYSILIFVQRIPHRHIEVLAGERNRLMQIFLRKRQILFCWNVHDKVNTALKSLLPTKEKRCRERGSDTHQCGRENQHLFDGSILIPEQPSLKR